MEILLLIMIFVLGLCFGSFVNMLTYRIAVKYGLTKNKIFNKNRSFCDYCGRQLNWYENIPVISWLVQKGKTRCCHKKLPILYPIVELLMGMLFVTYFLLFFNISWQFVLGFLILVLLVFSTVFDLKYMILPDFATFILVGLALLIWITGDFGNWNYFLAAAGGSLFLLILHLITKGKGMGLGDVKLAFFMGLFLGIQKTIVAFYVAFIVGAIIGVILMIFGKIKKKTQIPFGPFLILGTLMAWFLGSKIIELI
jgi:prepilin signal peptidase PulO-like enzyme (type II secretory pathway)